MAPSIPTVDVNRATLESQLREAYGRVAYTHKTHEKMAERLACNLKTAKWLQIILSALTAGGAIGAAFDKNSPWLPAVTAVLSVMTLASASYVKDLDPGAEAQKHREVASDLWNVRESYLSLLTDCRDNNNSIDDLKARRDQLHDRLYRIYKRAPHTDGAAYGKAQDALKNKEDLTFSEAEIDALLPQPLKRSGSIAQVK